MILEEIIEKDKYYESEYKDKDEEHERKVEKGKATASSMPGSPISLRITLMILPHWQFNGSQFSIVL